MRSLTVLAIFLLNYGFINAQFTKKVVIEEFVGTWCGLCPGATVIMDSLTMNYENTIGVAYHLGDVMSFSESEQMGEVYTGGGVPAFLLNRYHFPDYPVVSFGIDKDLVTQKLEEKLNEPADVGVFFEEVGFNEVKNEFIVSLNAEFLENSDEINNDLRFNLLVLEEELITDEADYSQSNYYNLVEDHPYSDYDDKISNFPHKHVARMVLGGIWGEENSIVIDKNNLTHHHTFTFTLNSNWNPQQIKLVAMVQRFDEDYTLREILNAESFDLNSILPTSFIDNETWAGDNKIKIFPNPIHQQFTIQLPFEPNNTFLEVFNLNGQFISQMLLLNQKNHFHIQEIIPNNENGVFLLKITNENNTFWKKIIIN